MAPATEATALDVSSQPASQPQQRDMLLRALYGLSSGLSLFQLLWFNRNERLLARMTLGQVPASAVPVIERATAKGIGKAFSLSPGGALFFARGFVTKYHNQTFIGLTHILAAPFWSAIIPLQLHPGLRKRFKRLHRVLGLIFFSLSASLMAGFGAIMKKKLQLSPDAFYGKGIEGLQRRPLPLVLRVLNRVGDPFLLVSAAWFSYTLMRSWSAILRRRFVEHEEWVLRHVASGQWISLMRILQGTVFMPSIISRFGDTKAVISSQFGAAGGTAWIICLVCAEIAVLRTRANRASAKLKASPSPEIVVDDRMIGA